MNRLERWQRRAELAGVPKLLGLPERLQRRLVGAPVVIDGQTLATETQLLLKLMDLNPSPPAERLPIAQGRRLIDHQSELVGGDQTVRDVRSFKIPGPASELPVRLYVPSGSQRPDPLLVFFHGGGWIYGGLESHDAVCRFLATRAGIRVLAVDYRLAPEAPFPAAYDDALAALDWVLSHPDEIGADPARIGVGGDSAGGALSAAVAIEAARRGVPLAMQLLVYPATDMTASMTSRRTFAEGFFLTAEFMDLAKESYLSAGEEADPRASVLVADLPAGLAPAYVVTAGFDPLRDEGEAYARKLSEAGVEVESRRFPDMIHGFFNMVGVGRTAQQNVREIAAVVRARMHA